MKDACFIFWILNSNAVSLFTPHKANFSFYERCYISQIRYNCCSNLSVRVSKVRHMTNFRMSAGGL